MNRKHFDYIFGNICRVQKQLGIPWLPIGAFEKVLYSAELWAREYNGITLSQIIGVHPVMHMTGFTASYVSCLLFDPHWEPAPALLVYLKLSDWCAKYSTLLGLALVSANHPSRLSLSTCPQRCICSSNLVCPGKMLAKGGTFLSLHILSWPSPLKCPKLNSWTANPEMHVVSK